MKKLLSFLICVLCVIQSFAMDRINIAVSTQDLTGVSYSRSPVTLTPVSPLPRVYTTNTFSMRSVTLNTDTNGLVLFTNVLWGNYTLTIQGNPPTVYQIQVGTNLSGTVAAPVLYTNFQTLPPNPVTNYYTQSQVDALIAGAAGFTFTGDASQFGNNSGTIQIVNGAAVTNLLATNISNRGGYTGPVITNQNKFQGSNISTFGITVSNATPSSIAGFDAGANLTNIILGANLSLTGGTLNATGGNSSVYDASQFGTNQASQIVQITNGALITNSILKGSTVIALGQTPTGQLGITNVANQSDVSNIVTNLTVPAANFAQSTNATITSSDTTHVATTINAPVGQTGDLLDFKINGTLFADVAPSGLTIDSVTTPIITNQNTFQGSNITAWTATISNNITVPSTGTITATNLVGNSSFGTNSLKGIAIETFGAVADGVTGCGAAFQAALNSHTNVLIHAGTWLIDQNLFATNDSHLISDGGAVLLFATNLTGNEITTPTNCVNVVYMGLTFEGSYALFHGGGDFANGDCRVCGPNGWGSHAWDYLNGVNTLTNQVVQNVLGLRSGLQISAQQTNSYVINCNFQNLSDTGLRIVGGQGTFPQPRYSTLVVQNCHWDNNWIGCALTNNAEYLTLDNCQGHANGINVGVWSGNVQCNGGDFQRNCVGAKISGVGGAQNPAHGKFSNCTFNHCDILAVMDNFFQGEQFENCNAIGQGGGNTCLLQLTNVSGVFLLGRCDFTGVTCDGGTGSDSGMNHVWIVTEEGDSVIPSISNGGLLDYIYYGFGQGDSYGSQVTNNSIAWTYLKNLTAPQLTGSNITTANIVVSNAAASSLAGFDAAHNLTNLTVGIGLSLTGGTLNATGGGGGGGGSIYDPTQFGTNVSAGMVQITNGAFVTNLLVTSPLTITNAGNATVQLKLNADTGAGGTATTITANPAGINFEGTQFGSGVGHLITTAGNVLVGGSGMVQLTNSAGAGVTLFDLLVGDVFASWSNTVPVARIDTNGNIFAQSITASNFFNGSAANLTNVNLKYLKTYYIADYGAPTDGVSDCTSAIQAAINASTNTDGGIIKLLAGTNWIKGGYISVPGATNNSVICQLYFPAINVTTAKMPTIIIEGADDPSVNDNWTADVEPLSSGGSILMSTNKPGTNTWCVIGTAPPIGDSWGISAVQVGFRNLTLRQYNQAVNDFANFHYAGQMIIEHVAYDQGIPTGLIGQTTALGSGNPTVIKCPGVGNWAHSFISDFDMKGGKIGLEMGEHLMFKDIRFWRTEFPMYIPTAQNHAIVGDDLLLTTCPWGLYCLAPARIKIDEWRVEHHTAWTGTNAWMNAANGFDIEDVSDNLSGIVFESSVTSDVGPDDTFTRNGGTNLIVYDLGSSGFNHLNITDQGTNLFTFNHFANGDLTPAEFVGASNIDYVKNGTERDLNGPVGTGTFRLRVNQIDALVMTATQIESVKPFVASNDVFTLKTLVSTNLQMTNLSASTLAGFDSARQLTNISLGSGLTLIAGQLSATGGGGGSSSIYDPTQFGTNQAASTVQITNGALTTNLVQVNGLINGLRTNNAQNITTNTNNVFYAQLIKLTNGITGIVLSSNGNIFATGVISNLGGMLSGGNITAPEFISSSGNFQANNDGSASFGNANFDNAGNLSINGLIIAGGTADLQVNTSVEGTMTEKGGATITNTTTGIPLLIQANRNFYSFEVSNYVTGSFAAISTNGTMHINQSNASTTFVGSFKASNTVASTSGQQVSTPVIELAATVDNTAGGVAEPFSWSFGATGIKTSTNFSIIELYNTTNNISSNVVWSMDSFGNMTNAGSITSPKFYGDGSGLSNILVSDVVGTTTNGLTIIPTNMVLNTIYTNLYGYPVIVQAVSVVYTEASGAGRSSLTLSLTNNGIGTNINSSQVTAVGIATGAMTNSFPTFTVTNNGTFVFTDTSSGVGNSAAVVGGQWVFLNQLAVATSFAGNGSLLTSLTAANITGSGTLPNGVLSPSVVLTNVGQANTNLFSSINITNAVGTASGVALNTNGNINATGTVSASKLTGGYSFVDTWSFAMGDWWSNNVGDGATITPANPTNNPTGLNDGWAFVAGPNTNAINTRFSPPIDWDQNGFKLGITAYLAGTNSANHTNAVFGIRFGSIASAGGSATNITWSSFQKVTNHINTNIYVNGYCETLVVLPGGTIASSNDIVMQVVCMGNDAGNTFTNTNGVIIASVAAHLTRNLTNTFPSSSQ